jgi:hypothetical protein
LLSAIIAFLWAVIHDIMGEMAKKRKKKSFSVVQAVKEMARERIGAPPVSRVVPDRKRKSKAQPKNPPKLQDLLDDL